MGIINQDKTKILSKSLPAYIIDKNNGFMPGFSPTDYKYTTNEKVKFSLYETTNPKTGLPFSFARNVRPYNDKT